MSGLEWFNLVMVVLTTAGFLSFVILYALLAEWWKEPISQVLMALAAICALFLILALSRLIWDGNPWWWQWLRSFCWLMLTATALRLPWVFLKTRAAGRPREPRQKGTGNMRQYGKLWAALGTLLLAVLVAVIDPANGITVDDGIKGTEWYLLGGLVVAAATVAIAPDVPGHRYIKPVLMALVAAYSTLSVVAVSDGLSVTEIIMTVVTVLGVFVVRKTRNVGDYGDRAAPALRP